MLSLLTQPLYAGEYRVRWRWSKGRRTERPEAEQYAVRVLDPPLVSPEDFERAQAILAGRQHRVLRARGDVGIYHGHADCARCGAELWMHAELRQHGGRGAYFCGARRRGTCTQGHVAVVLADPVIDEALELRLGSAEVLARLLDQAAEEARTRRAPATDLGRQLAELHNRRTRVQDGLVSGAFTPREAAKRIADFEGQIAALEELVGREEPAPRRVDAALVAELVDVFGSWRDLARGEKRRLLAAYRVRVALRTTKRRRAPEVDSVAVGLLSRNGVRIYKDMPSRLRDAKGESP